MKAMKLVAVGLLVAASTASGSTSLDDVVAANYPAVLSEAATQHHYTETRQQGFVAVTISGKSYIVAAYSNGHVGAVELLEGSATGAAPLQVISDHHVGSGPNVSARDLDGDSQPEFIVNFGLGPRGGSETWIYRVVNGQRLGRLLRSAPERQEAFAEALGVNYRSLRPAGPRQPHGRARQ